MDAPIWFVSGFLVGYAGKYVANKIGKRLAMRDSRKRYNNGW